MIFTIIVPGTYERNPPSMVCKNDRICVTIEDYTSDGFGVAKVEGFVLFVPGGVLGDVAEVHVLKVLQSSAYAKIISVLTPSPHRIESACAYHSKCGGCTFWQMDYAEELRLKAARVEQNLIRLGGVEQPNMRPAVGAETLFGYRNKAQYPVRMQNGEAVAGFFAAHSHRLIETERCAIQPPIFDQIVHFILQYVNDRGITAYDEQRHKGTLRHIYLRKSKDNKVMVCLVLTRLSFPRDFAETLQNEFREIEVVCLNENREKTNVILGKKTVYLTKQTCLYDTLLGKRFALSPHAFYQVNRDQCQRLYQTVAALADITPEDTVLDLYCGIGTIGICVADRAKKLCGIEIIPQAVENAKENAVQNGLQNAEFYCADAKEGAKMLLDRGYRFDCVIVDPPRKGCDESTIAALKALAPERLVYVSCDPATLARDIKRLEGFTLISATPVDLFPRTAHIETAALLKRS